MPVMMRTYYMLVKMRTNCTPVMMRTNCTPAMQMKKRETRKQIKKQRKIMKKNFMGFFIPQQFALPVHYLREVFIAHLVSFWS